MAFCTKCGKPVLPGQEFCAACGAPLEESEPQVTPPSAPEPQVTPPSAPEPQVTPPPPGPATPPPTTTSPPKTRQSPIDWFKKRRVLYGVVGLVIVILLAVFVVYPLVSPPHDPALVSYSNALRTYYGSEATILSWDTSWDSPNTLRITSSQTWGSGANATTYTFTEVAQKFSTTSEATAALSSKTTGLTLDPTAIPYADSPIAIATGDTHPTVYLSYYLPNAGGYNHYVNQWDNYVLDYRWT
jgi:hypothetical protein